MEIKFYNTLSGKIEQLKPIESKKIGLYTCGPTVYNFAHIGNLRTYLFEDILRRTLEYNGFKVNHIMNITDVGHLTSDEDSGDDKIEKAALEQKKDVWEIAEFYTRQFNEDISDLNIKPASIMPKATEHINEQIEIIKILEQKGFTYKTSDGIYFDTSKFKDYGKLGNINIKNLKEGARVEKIEDKKNITDFSLWKFSPSEKKRQMEWESPWGVGFPGWHIECSGMSTKYLGQPFDIHTGGIDHIPVHHQNEIAQSEAAYDKSLANYWMHGEFLITDQKKMAKSAGTFITLENLKAKGYNPLAYRYFVLGAHYRTPLNFSWEALGGAQNGLESLHNQLSAFGFQLSGDGKINKEYKEKFLEKINNDLNTPQALALVYEVLKSDLNNEDKLATILDFDKVLGLKLEDALKPVEIPQEIIDMAEKRQQARAEKNWGESDKLRDEIRKSGYEIEDLDSGYIVKKQ